MAYRIEFVSRYYDGRDFVEKEITYWNHYEHLSDAEDMACKILDADREDEHSAIMSLAILNEDDEVIIDSGSYFYKPLRWGAE
jgi:hypothetical protein